MKEWILNQGDAFYRKVSNKKLGSSGDETNETGFEYAKNLASSPQFYKKIITCEWCFVFFLLTWLVLIFTTILH